MISTIVNEIFCPVVSMGSWLNISHHLFVDDTLIFYDANPITFVTCIVCSYVSKLFQV
jgi:hypothetical protein